MSSKQVTVAAMKVAAVSLDETQSAFDLQNQPVAEVAAVKSQKNKNQKNKNKGQNNKAPRGQKHSSVPEGQADKMCDRHYSHGAGAWYCLKPSSCPWKDKISPRT